VKFELEIEVFVAPGVVFTSLMINDVFDDDSIETKTEPSIIILTPFPADINEQSLPDNDSGPIVDSSMAMFPDVPLKNEYGLIPLPPFVIITPPNVKFPPIQD
jgi:hypothetical protein